MGQLVDDIQKAIDMQSMPLWLRTDLSDALEAIQLRDRTIAKLASVYELEPSGWATVTVHGHGDSSATVARVLLEPDEAETLRAVNG